MKIRGLDSLQRKLRRLGKVVEQATDAAAEEIAEEVAWDAEAMVPVDSGELRDSIEVEKTKDGYRVGPRDDVEHALFVEWGTSRSPAQPYMQPAAAGKQKKYRKVAAAEINRRVRRM